MSFPYLSTIIFLPVVGAIIIAFLPGLSSRLIKRIAALLTFIPLVLSIILFINFDRSLGAAGVIQFEEKLPWIASLNANYHLGVDGLSLPLVVLMAFLVPAVLMAYSSRGAWLALPWLTLPLLLRVVAWVMLGRDRDTLHRALKGTSALHLFFGLMLALALVIEAQPLGG